MHQLPVVYHSQFALLLVLVMLRMPAAQRTESHVEFPTLSG
jgi:hypothetical protein